MGNVDYSNIEWGKVDETPEKEEVVKALEPEPVVPNKNDIKVDETTE